MSHLGIILEFMSSHPEFAKGKLIGPTGKAIQKRLWQDLTNLLNTEGFGQKPVQKWQKMWTDFKYNLKKKAAALKRQQNETGGGAPEITGLNALEERALQILGNSFFEGVGVEELGLQSQSTKRKIPEVEQEIAVEINMAYTNENVPQTSSDHSYVNKTRVKQPRYTVNEEFNLCKESVEILEEIKNVVRDGLSAINNTLCDINNTLKHH